MAGLDAHLKMHDTLEGDVDAFVTLATKLPLADGASTHASPTVGVAGAEPDVFSADTYVACMRATVALAPRTANRRSLRAACDDGNRR